MKINLYNLLVDKKYKFYLNNGSIIIGTPLYIEGNNNLNLLNLAGDLGSNLEQSNKGNFECVYLLDCELDGKLIPELIININSITMIELS